MHETLHRPDESTFRKKRCHRHRRRRVPIDLILNEILIEETFKENISERGKKKKKNNDSRSRSTFRERLAFWNWSNNTL